MSEAPIDGMKTKPMGLHLPGMPVMWLGCVIATTEQAPALELFHAATGYDLRALIGRTPMEQMIDWATGREREIIVAWCDWVTVNVWGEERETQRDE